jgi:hypothetical protein
MGSTAEHSQLVKDCLEELALMGYVAWQNRTGAGELHGRFIRFGKYGSGDIIAVLPKLMRDRDGQEQIVGIHAELEAKTGDAVQKKNQKTHMQIVRNNGGVYLVVRKREEVAVELAALGFQPSNPAYRPSSGSAALL